MNFYVTLTTNCNLRCKYCYEKSCEDFGSDFHGLAIDYSIPSSVTYRTNVLRKFVEQDSSDPVLIFYGGEPLLKIKMLKEAMDAIPNAHFVIQTNGLLLDRIDSDYLNRLDSIFVSLDGDEALTDYYRGKGTYKPRSRRLVRAWGDHMRNAGEVWRMYPFVGITHSMLNGDSSHLRCGAGWRVFNIQTDGNITPCPVMAGIKDFYLGNIRDASFDRLKDAVFVSEPCTSCKVFTICGGRCLYANATKLWGAEGFNQVCDTVIRMIEELFNAVPPIKSLIESGKIQQEDFEYPKYNGCEIIP